MRTSHADLTGPDREPSALPAITLGLLRRRAMARHGWYRVLLEDPPSGSARGRVTGRRRQRPTAPSDRSMMVVVRPAV